jgi:hydroxymethylglutaryl-CoA reductase
MTKKETIGGFYKLSRNEKLDLLNLDETSRDILNNALVQDEKITTIVDGLSENTISHFPFPMGVAPNVWINNKNYFLPLVTEESSVIAAIAKAAKFWANYGGFETKIIGTEKKGQVHFFWKGSKELLLSRADALKEFIMFRVRPYTRRMLKRGGGINNLELLDKTYQLENYFQLDVSFETRDAMGANFINTCLEDMAKSLKQFVSCDLEMNNRQLDVSMAILSNYTPNCLVKTRVKASIDDLNSYGKTLGTENLAVKLVQAVQIAQSDVSRAVTHNKGIFNGIDAIALATGNDWRALEASGHAYASRNGKYTSLSVAYIEQNLFILELELPISVGTIGGVTQLHPLAKVAMQILGNPNAEELMQIMAVSGLAANFSAILALTTAGIQKGHMKMHLSNMLLQLQANEEQKKAATSHFQDKLVSYADLEQFLKNLS